MAAAAAAAAAAVGARVVRREGGGRRQLQWEPPWRVKVRGRAMCRGRLRDCKLIMQ